MLALPPERDTDKQEIFRLAMASDDERPSMAIGSDDFASMIVRFWQHVPPPLALAAIHQVLDAARSQDGSLSPSTPLPETLASRANVTIECLSFSLC
jgi:hypothetical protein